MEHRTWKTTSFSVSCGFHTRRRLRKGGDFINSFMAWVGGKKALRDEILARFPAAMNDPFKIELCGDSLKTVLVLLCVYGLAIGVYLSSRRNYRRGEEHGSAKWGNARAVNKKYQAANPEENKILTQNVRMGFDGKKHRRSLNTVVVGGSGAGKTRFYAKPNLCQAANAASHGTSYVVLDPKGEMLRDTPIISMSTRSESL